MARSGPGICPALLFKFTLFLLGSRAQRFSLRGDSRASRLEIPLLGLYKKQIVDVSPLSNLAGLKQLDLSDNQIENIAPLLVEPGLGRGDLLDITSNPLETFDGTIGKAHIDLLIQRGVGVLYDPIQVVDGAVQTCERKPL